MLKHRTHLRVGQPQRLFGLLAPGDVTHNAEQRAAALNISAARAHLDRKSAAILSAMKVSKRMPCLSACCIWLCTKP
jgi:hypothetical protein